MAAILLANDGLATPLPEVKTSKKARPSSRRHRRPAMAGLEKIVIAFSVNMRSDALSNLQSKIIPIAFWIGFLALGVVSGLATHIH